MTATVPESLLTCLAIIGVAWICKFVLKASAVFVQTFVLRGKTLKKYASKSGSWAVVTGATDGIGKEFALQLATKGFNVLLVSRNEARLLEVANEIKEKYNCTTRTAAVDFACATEEHYRALEDKLLGLDVGVLVNNVGRSHEFPVPFADTDVEEQEAIIAINVTATLRVTQLVLKNMMKQRRGLILTLSSFAGAIPSPLLATYSGSKAFLQTWSAALQAELSENNIDVECVSTYFVVSNMSRIRRASTFIPMPKAFVASVLRKICLPCGALWTGRPSVSTPYWSHSVLDYLINMVGWKALFIRYTLALHKDIRKRALRKKERESKQQ